MKLRPLSVSALPLSFGCLPTSRRTISPKIFVDLMDSQSPLSIYGLMPELISWRDVPRASSVCQSRCAIVSPATSRTLRPPLLALLRSWPPLLLLLSQVAQQSVTHSRPGHSALLLSTDLAPVLEILQYATWSPSTAISFGAGVAAALPACLPSSFCVRLAAGCRLLTTRWGTTFGASGLCVGATCAGRMAATA